MFTNLAIPNWGTTLLYYVQVQYFLVNYVNYTSNIS